jgi:hypothetical protein
LSVGRPLHASVGLGDMLIYRIFVVAADKTFGRRGAALAIATVVVSGALAPSTASSILTQFNQGQSNLVVPAQVFFSPATFAVATWLYHRAPTRNIGDGPRPSHAQPSP